MGLCEVEHHLVRGAWCQGRWWQQQEQEEEEGESLVEQQQLKHKTGNWFQHWGQQK